MKKLLYLFLTVLIVACSGEDGSNDGDNNQSSCPIYLDSNGITIKACNDANVGDTGVVNGITYTVVDEAMLREMVENEQDVTKVATTKVTDMFSLFYLGNDNNDNTIYNDFNQDISSWDVSSVIDMGYMFAFAYLFNQDISSWDVSNVRNMQAMFREVNSFNQTIGGWDVSSLKNMNYMFQRASSFNQPLDSWNVSNVTDMRYMFNRAETFNQPIGDWDVSNVTDMRYLFNNAIV